MQSLLDVVFDLCYYGHQNFGAVLDMEIYDIEWMHRKLADTKKAELKNFEKKIYG